MISSSLRCVQYGSNVDKFLFTVVKLRNNVSLATAGLVRRSSSIVNSDLQRHHHRPNQHLVSRFSSTMSSSQEFRIADYDIIGFDLDGTLLRYNLNTMVPLVYELLVKYLVEERGYPRVMLEKPFNSDYMQKGLIVDAERGNILKLSADGVILKAAHGTRFLQDSEIEAIYGKARTWSTAIEYIDDPLSAWNGPVSEKLRSLLDYFDLAASLVFGHAVDAIDEVSQANENILEKNNYKIWPDLLSGLIKIYTREHFANGESPYFKALKAQPEKYIMKTDRSVLNLLRDLKSSGKALYLLTGSNIDFANLTATYALGPDWKSLFNVVVSFGKKPGFFFMQRQFLQVKNLMEVEGSEISLQDTLTTDGSCFSQGNWQQLKASLSKNVIGKDDQQTRCLYVGDNLIQDVYAPFTKASMDTIALSEELLENDDNYEYKNIVHSTMWGSYFSVNGTATLWSKNIEKYSRLCVSTMDVVAGVPVTDKIISENKQGFYPTAPESLLER
ncbi:5'-nucleotidase domain-containing protein 1 [Musca vetustissima]|uniref:5'-nucleotidase domain-containing protein 1 n=1 Tax=Musca vetustissima TaxID=27455 RepID=UPI002AB6B4E1|nr:5'-nucleotidase domain-containing protein 1 [Musca vetustissima]